MKKLLLIVGSVLVCLLFLLTGWILGRADYSAQTNSFSAQVSIITANNLEKKGQPITDQLFSQIDAAVESMDLALPLVIDLNKRNQIQATYLKVAEFRDKHPAWIQYYNGYTLQKDDRTRKHVDAILSKAKERQ